MEEGRRRHPKRGETKGFGGRFGAGLPRINDGSFLFIQHMMSKVKSVAKGGSRPAIVFNGSPAVHRGSRGLRTDLALCSPTVADAVVHVAIRTDERVGAVAPDHAPLVVGLDVDSGFDPKWRFDPSAVAGRSERGAAAGELG